MIQTQARKAVEVIFGEIEPQLRRYVDIRLQRNYKTNFADDAVSEVFVRMIQRFDSGGFPQINEGNWQDTASLEYLKAWAFVTVRYTLMEMIRKSCREDHGSDGLDNVGSEPEDPLAKPEAIHEAAKKVRRVLARGPDVLKMAGINGRSDAKIAEELHISEVTVRVIRCRLRKWLHDRLK